MSNPNVQYYGNGQPAGTGMRPSRVLRKTRAGGVASSFKCNLTDPRAAEIAAMAGFDCLWVCFEHVPCDFSAVENQVRAAKIYDVDTVVRVPRGSYSDYIRGFEMDATGIMVPHIMDAEDAASVVRMTKFPPIGRRAVDGGNADGGYCRYPLTHYLETANAERWVVFQIEDPEAVPHLEAIAELPGVDMLLFGPGDYSVAIGKPGQTGDPEIEKVRRQVAAVARKHGKMAGTPGTPANLRDLVNMGYNFVNCGADVVGLMQYVDAMVGAFSDLGE